ncbi:hypothetical protein BS78_03G093600 [Paspalum vaginatum]|nr:hypothetical protein BS78_03G093600 [Paspalum vaginatum]
MAISAAAPHPVALQSLTFSVLLGVLIAGAEGRHHVHDCPEFSCSHLRNVSYPFSRQGDPSGCGVPSYQLLCTDNDATIRIGSGIYSVLSINYTGSYFWVVDSSLSMQSSCPLPRWDYHDGDEGLHGKSHRSIEFGYSHSTVLSVFVNCSRRIENNGSNMEPEANANYPEVVGFMRKGFALRFPYTISGSSSRVCFAAMMRPFREEPRNSTGTKDRILDILTFDMDFWWCIIINNQQLTNTRAVYYLFSFMETTIPLTMWLLKAIYVVFRFVLMPLAAFIFLAHKYWKKRVTIDAVEKFLRTQQMLAPTRYAYTEIIAITNHFREELGQGGYGSVYKGVLLPGNVHVAVKILGNINCNGEEFISEVATIGKIHHVNVVRLIGFCSEETSRALVYEFMPHGSLDKYIFSSEKSFSWDKVNEIALGIARGINYLHQGCDMQIVHFDIKPHNILLDSNFVPKVADFGLAKLFPRDKSFVPLSAMRGTIGYIAPEMVSRSFGAISNKSDVYSFGMLLLEMAGGRKNADPHVASSSQAYYPALVYSQLIGEEVGEFSGDVNMHELEKKLCLIGLWCIQMRPYDRPTMGEVIEMLEGVVDDLQMPPRPFFCDDETVPEGALYHLSSELNTIEEDE